MKLNIKKNSIFKKIMISFLVFIIPLYIFLYVIYLWSVDTIQNENIKSVELQTKYCYKNIEYEINKIKKSQYDLLDFKDLNELSVFYENMDNYEKYISMNKIHNELIKIKESSQFVKDIKCHLSGVSKTISAVNGVDYLNNNIYCVDINKEIPWYQTFYYDNNTMYLILNKTSYNKKHNGVLFSIEVEFSNEFLMQELNKIIQIKDSCSILKNHNNKFIISNKYIDMTSKRDDWLIVTYDFKDWDMKIENYISKESLFKSIDCYKFYFTIFTLLSLLLIILFYKSIFKIIIKPIKQLLAAFNNVENGDMNSLIIHNNKDEFGFLFDHFNDMLNQLKQLIEQVYQQKIKTQRAELKHLQAQINPHFLYNSFFVLNTLVRVKDYYMLDYFTEQLGKYYRFITKNYEDNISLADEIEHARVYCNIQSVRFEGKIDIEFEKTPELMKDIMVPRLIIQPIIENAFKHGLKNKDERGLLRINFKEVDDFFEIIIEDNGEELNENNLNSMLRSKNNSLYNIDNRLKIKFNNASGLKFSVSEELGGLKVKIIVSK